MEHPPIPDAREERPTRRLYHMVPEDVRGNVLHPLNRLKNMYPDLYVAKAGKYEDRDRTTIYLYSDKPGEEKWLMRTFGITIPKISMGMP